MTVAFGDDGHEQGARGDRAGVDRGAVEGDVGAVEGAADRGGEGGGEELHGHRSTGEVPSGG